MKSKTEKSGPADRVVLGVDIGGTNTKYGYVDSRGNCIATASMPTDALKPAGSFFLRLSENSEALFGTLTKKRKMIGIGIGAPNANFYHATIENPPNLSWDYVDVRAELGRYYDLPVALAVVGVIHTASRPLPRVFIQKSARRTHDGSSKRRDIPSSNHPCDLSVSAAGVCCQSAVTSMVPPSVQHRWAHGSQDR